MRMAFFFDESRCMACKTCTVACKDYYNVNPGPVSYRKHNTHEIDDGVGGFYSFVMSCNHCEDPACKKACAAQAITKRSDGIVVVDRKKCREFRSCISACPFSAPGIADDRQETLSNDKWIVKHPMQKCNMCVELLDKGELPVCVRACPVHAIDIGDYNEILSKHTGAEELTIDKFPYAYSNNSDTSTGPSILVKPRKELKITGKYK